jgi:hypothetical protein
MIPYNYNNIEGWEGMPTIQMSGYQYLQLPYYDNKGNYIWISPYYTGKYPYYKKAFNR